LCLSPLCAILACVGFLFLSSSGMMIVASKSSVSKAKDAERIRRK
jgi:hypothetical protein